MNSIIQTKQECYICHTTNQLHCHHIFEGTANRNMSEKYGLKIWLCYKHHNGSNMGVHFNKDLDLKLKQMAQKQFEKTYDISFISIFNRNYL